VNYAVVGLFVLVLGAALIAVVLWLASGGALRQKHDLFMAIMDESVSGLSTNAPVKYNGVEVGKVRDIRLHAGNPERVDLLFAIERGTPVKEDTVAVLKTQGLTGIAYVELSGGARDAPPLRATPGSPYPVIQTKTSLSARLENVLTNVLTKLDGTSGAIAAFLSQENQVAFKEALANISVVTRTLAARKDSLDSGIAAAARTFENGARATAQLGPALERISRAADAVEKMGNEVSVTGASAAKTIGTIDAGVKRVTAETLPELDRLIGEMNVLAGSLRRLSEKIEGSPGGLLLGRSQVPPGPGEAAPKK
jgi:phospholipid/cholesterol/gamma-HCH transport system substrate-binding protein